MLLIENIKIYQDLTEEEAIEKAIKKASVQSSDVLDSYIFKKSIDARNKNDVHYLYTICIKVKDENKYSKLKKYNEPVIKINVNRKSEYRPIIIGSGPSGLFCALTLIKYGIKPIIIEQGKPVEERINDVRKFKEAAILDPNSNVLFGEGGAGTFSDGKLNTNVNNEYVREVLKTFYSFGAPKEITYLNKPHIGTDNLINILKNIRNHIIDNGGTYFFNTKFIDYQKEDNLFKVICNNNTFITDTLVLAIGHSANDTYQLLKEKGVKLERKVFAIGVRIEHLQKMINESQYGLKTKLKLPNADYKLVYHNNDRSAYTFCMCPGGFVMASSSDENRIVTNGMSNFKRDGINSNSALLVNIFPTDLKGDDVLEGLKFQKEIEEKAFKLAGSNYNAPISKVIDYKNNTISTELGSVIPTYKPGYSFVNINELFPDFINQTLKEAIDYFDTKIKGFNSDDAIITAPETRSSAPITIVRDLDYNCSVEHLIPIGEGSGYAGGITTSAIDGIKAAIKILEDGK